ncbi:hypothetical protein SAMN05421788_105356 [Filimonas lacunae]|uniref:BAAT / Acyl-CoA thioester hydrolase C terminal n=1 Tax=Filimonas lacunae TaxID=477680 RepID=A0A173MCD3_9BACT|nr:hypothetical protein [Filimonas lacunae]BAV05187.1 hypothetical protein FLA_1194 [Filimonas lacunae]SIT22728.1 hypothetical protein SAMN05421788_105356 [Filimonas lacunae]
MKLLSFVLALLSFSVACAQDKPVEAYGCRLVQTVYKGDTVHILVKSKKGEEQVKKPLFFFCQGSMAQPLLKYDDDGMYGVFPFNTDSLSQYYHLVIAGKPGVPLQAGKKQLGDNFVYLDSTGRLPDTYRRNNHLDYYVQRDEYVLRFLEKQPWVATGKLVIAGHSEGACIAANLAAKDKKVTQLIYSGGNPLGRIMSMVRMGRDTETDTAGEGEKTFALWEKIADNPTDTGYTGMDSYQTTYSFSHPLMHLLDGLKMPVLVSYGSKDHSAYGNDYWRLESIRRHKKNFTYKVYIGTEHNYFPVRKDGSINYEVFNWDKVANEWCAWLLQQ